LRRVDDENDRAAACADRAADAMTIPDTSIHWPGRFATPRVLARPLGGDDAVLFAALYVDAYTMAQIGEPLGPEAADRAFAAALRQMRRAPPSARYWRLDEGDDPLGLLSLVPDAERRTAETGLMLVGAGRARGIAREVLAALLPPVLVPGGLDALWTRHRVGHGAAEGLMRGLRFEKVGATGWSRWQMTATHWQMLVGRARSV